MLSVERAGRSTDNLEVIQADKLTSRADAAARMSMQ
jgi:hypothetical protein